MLYTELRKGQSVMIGDAKVTMSEVKSNKVRLAIDAEKSIKVLYEGKDGSFKAKQDA